MFVVEHDGEPSHVAFETTFGRFFSPHPESPTDALLSLDCIKRGAELGPTREERTDISHNCALIGPGFSAGPPVDAL